MRIRHLPACDVASLWRSYLPASHTLKRPWASRLPKVLNETFKTFPFLNLCLYTCGAQFVDMTSPLTNTSVLCAKRRP